MKLVHGMQRGLAIMSSGYGKAFMAQAKGDKVPYILLVIHDQYLFLATHVVEYKEPATSPEVRKNWPAGVAAQLPGYEGTPPTLGEAGCDVSANQVRGYNRAHVFPLPLALTYSG